MCARMDLAAPMISGTVGRRSAVASHPGGKLYLLLQQELERAGLRSKRSLRQALLPNRLPPAIALGSANETLRARLVRRARQTYFTLLRLRFHLVEGLRYLWESTRWQHYVDGLDR